MGNREVEQRLKLRFENSCFNLLIAFSILPVVKCERNSDVLTLCLSLSTSARRENVF